jgi:hypothetical protein
MGNRGIVELATASGHADAHMHLDTQGMAMLFAPGAPIDPGLAAWLSGFNLVVSYLFDPDGTLAENMKRAGVRTYLDCPHRIAEGAGHAVDQLARPLQRLAFFVEPDAEPRIRLPVEADRPKRRIAIHPGSGSNHKNWAMEHWARAGREIVIAYPDTELALVTGEAELERGVVDYMNKQWQGLAVVHWHSLPLSTLASKLPTCLALLGHDSGVTHLAAACGVPCHAFFGASDPATWCPRGNHVRHWAAPDRRLDTLRWEVGWSVLEQFLDALPLER